MPHIATWFSPRARKGTFEMVVFNVFYFGFAMALGVLVVTLVEGIDWSVAKRFNRALPTMGFAYLIGILLGAMFGMTVTADSPAPMAESLVSSVPVFALGVVYGRWKSGRDMYALSMPISILGTVAIYASFVWTTSKVMNLRGWAIVTADQLELGRWFALVPIGLTIVIALFTMVAGMVGKFWDADEPHDQHVAFVVFAMTMGCWVVLRVIP